MIRRHILLDAIAGVVFLAVCVVSFGLLAIMVAS